MREQARSLVLVPPISREGILWSFVLGAHLTLQHTHFINVREQPELDGQLSISGLFSSELFNGGAISAGLQGDGHLLTKVDPMRFVAGAAFFVVLIMYHMLFLLLLVNLLIAMMGTTYNNVMSSAKLLWRSEYVHCFHKRSEYVHCFYKRSE